MRANFIFQNALYFSDMINGAKIIKNDIEYVLTISFAENIEKNKHIKRNLYFKTKESALEELSHFQKLFNESYKNEKRNI